MFITTNNELGFIHIPKCGGTSVWHAFAGVNDEYRQRTDMPYSPWPIYSTHTKWQTVYNNPLGKKKYDQFPPPKQWFSIVRNPYARYHTWFYFQQTWDRKRYNGELPLKPNMTMQDLEFRLKYWETATPLSVLENMDSIDQSKHWLYAIGNIRACQTTWIEGSNARLFKLENMQELWAWLELIGSHVKPTHSKKNTEKTGTWQDFDNDVLELIEQRYAEDFELLRYDKVRITRGTRL